MGQRKQPSSTLTEAQREAAAKALREAAKAIYVTAADAYILTVVVGDLAVILVRLAGRLPREWGEAASDRVSRGLLSGGANSTLGLLHAQALLAGAVRMDAGDRIDEAARAAWLASLSLLASKLAPTQAHKRLLEERAAAQLATALERVRDR
jgi:truncated hemoglobin YjbI